MIVKKGSQYQLQSKKTHRNLGTYPTRAGAEKRERQVEFFKHLGTDNEELPPGMKVSRKSFKVRTQPSTPKVSRRRFTVRTPGKTTEGSHYNLAQTAQFLGTSPEAVMQRVLGRRLYGYNTGNDWQFKKEDVHRHAADQGSPFIVKHPVYKSQIEAGDTHEGAVKAAHLNIFADHPVYQEWIAKGATPEQAVHAADSDMINTALERINKDKLRSQVNSDLGSNERVDASRSRLFGMAGLPPGMKMDNEEIPGVHVLQDLASAQYPGCVTRVTHKDGQECHHYGQITLPNGKAINYRGVAYGKDGNEGVAIHKALFASSTMPPGMKLANLDYTRISQPPISWAAAHRGEECDGHVVEPFDGVACDNDDGPPGFRKLESINAVIPGFTHSLTKPTVRENLKRMISPLNPNPAPKYMDHLGRSVNPLSSREGKELLEHLRAEDNLGFDRVGEAIHALRNEPQNHEISPELMDAFHKYDSIAQQYLPYKTPKADPYQSDRLYTTRFAGEEGLGMDNEELQPIENHYEAKPTLMGDESRVATLVAPDNKLYDISQIGRRAYHEQAVNHSPHLFGVDPNAAEYDQFDHALDNGTIRVQQGWNHRKREPAGEAHLHFDGDVRSPSDIIELIDSGILPDENYYGIGWGGSSLGRDTYEPIVSQAKLRALRNWNELRPKRSIESSRARMFGMDNEDEGEVELSSSKRPCLNLLFGE